MVRLDKARIGKVSLGQVRSYLRAWHLVVDEVEPNDIGLSCDGADNGHGEWRDEF